MLQCFSPQGTFQKKLQELSSLTWWKVDFTVYKSVVEWYLMSADCKVVIRHPDRNPLDVFVNW